MHIDDSKKNKEPARKDTLYESVFPEKKRHPEKGRRF
jgi:hypothetical protein